MEGTTHIMLPRLLNMPFDDSNTVYWKEHDIYEAGRGP